jgi:predicted aspartyl protease
LIGDVDSQLRAVVSIMIGSGLEVDRVPIPVWVDTAFNGGLVIPREIAAFLELKRLSTAEAILADGNLVELETFQCYFEWFG